MLIISLLSALLLWGCSAPPPSVSDNGTPAADTPPPVVSWPPPSVTPPPVPEKIKESKTLKGIFRGLEAGEYRKAAIEISGEEYGGIEDYFLSNDEALLYFLAANLDKPLDFTYNVLERTASQRGSGSGEIEKLVAAKNAQGLTHEAWWQQQKAANPDQNALRQKFDALVKAATIKEDEESDK